MKRAAAAKRVSSDEVARLAGVSRSTVSRTYTVGAYVSPAARERVLRAAEVLGYSPNAIARSLTMQRTRLIGVIVCQLGNPFYAQMLDEIGRALQARGLASLVLVSERERLDELIPTLLGYQVDGVIVTETTLSSKMAFRCQSAGIPVVLLNHYVESDVMVSVVGDNADGAAQVADHLVTLGHTRMAYMAGLPEASSSRDRELGFRSELARHGLPLQALAVGYATLEGGMAAARTLLAAPERPQAIFCANDLMAMAAIDVARAEFGLNVPGDLSVVGYDNSHFAALANYSLTSVDQHTHAMVEVAVGLLTGDGSAAPGGGPSTRLPATLIPRGSTGRPSA